MNYEEQKEHKQLIEIVNRQSKCLESLTEVIHSQNVALRKLNEHICKIDELLNK